MFVSLVRCVVVGVLVVNASGDSNEPPYRLGEFDPSGVLGHGICISGFPWKLGDPANSTLNTGKG